LAETNSIDMADGSSFWNGTGLAILFNNQGLVKNEFRAGLALVRVAESSVTAIVYFHLGLFVPESESLLLVITPSAVVGIPLGAYLFRRLDAETFRRICMSFDAWVVGFGLSRVLIELNFMKSPWAYSVMTATILIDVYLLYIFFTVHKAASIGSPTVRTPLISGGGNGLRDRVRSLMTGLPRDPFVPLFDLLGYVIAAVAIAMLAYTVSPSIRLPP
jgi:hypothetical protein